MQEIWKDVPEYEGLYQVSNLGSVRSLTHTKRSSNGKTARANGKVIKPLEQNGYLNIMLCKDGVRKRFRLHRLIASAFIPNPHNFPQVNHKDENKKNNNVENLEWCDSKYNNSYGTRLQRYSETMGIRVVQSTLDGDFVKLWKSASEAGRNGYTRENISKCCRGERETADGYKWKYVRKDAD